MKRLLRMVALLMAYIMVMTCFPVYAFDFSYPDSLHGERIAQTDIPNERLYWEDKIVTEDELNAAMAKLEKKWTGRAFLLTMLGMGLIHFAAKDAKKGDKGDTGDTGPAGPPGPTGPSGPPGGCHK